MNEEINIYCDESCYLQHDDSQFMSIGGIWCSKDKITKINADIKKIKRILMFQVVYKKQKTEH